MSQYWCGLGLCDSLYAHSKCVCTSCTWQALPMPEGLEAPGWCPMRARRCDKKPALSAHNSWCSACGIQLIHRVLALWPRQAWSLQDAGHIFHSLFHWGPLCTRDGALAAEHQADKLVLEGPQLCLQCVGHRLVSDCARLSGLT